MTAPVATKQDDPQSGRYWVRKLARYREPSVGRSLLELLVTAAPFLALAALAWWSLSISHALAAAISLVNGAFLLRLFIIQHDCGHGSFFRSRTANDWLGRLLGVLTMTPYDVWRKNHSTHHSAVGDLDHRGIGDLPTLTVREYRDLPRARRILYRVYRNPLFLFGIAPAYVFLVQNRLPANLMRAGSKYWISAMGTNLAIAAIVAGCMWALGVGSALALLLPTILVGSSLGMWLFYVQHQFEDTHWDRHEDWDLHDSALHGSSHYVLPPLLRWISGNIGLHHVHHLQSRIPFYRLTEVLRDQPYLDEVKRLTLSESLDCARRHLWDEDRRQLLSFAEARAV